MQKYLVMGGVVPMVGILILLNMVYSYLFQVENLYDQRMHRDMQNFTQELIQSGMAQAQINAIRSVLLDMNRNTLNYVSSEVSNLAGTFTAMGIIIMSFSFALAGSIPNQKKEG